jgi:hypothetical protein
MQFPDPQSIVDHLIELQSIVRDRIVQTRRQTGLATVSRSTAADTIYAIDAVVEPILEEFCADWAKATPLVLIAEGMEDEHGEEGPVTFPRGSRPEDAAIRIIMDPIDGTRGIMYDKRAAWALAAVAPNRGPATRLRDCSVSVMTELPTSKMGHADVLWAIKGRGAHGRRVDLSTGAGEKLDLRPSTADTIHHGFASISNFFPGNKVLAGELAEFLATELVGPADVTKAAIFEDQYICTGGQFYELIVGHDRFNADLRPLFYRIQKQGEGLCCHPYDIAGLLIAEEAGVIITDGLGNPLDAPMDTTAGVSWAGYANETLRAKIEPLLSRFLSERLKS